MKIKIDLAFFLLVCSLVTMGVCYCAKGAATASGAVGQTATLTVSAAGTAPFTYQWLKNDVPLSGATAATLVLSPLKMTDAANYKVTVLNSAGSTVSDVASLAVTSAVVSGGAADLSKQFAQAHLTAYYDPPVGQWQNGFAIVPLKKTNDPGNHFDDATGIYTVGVGEGGIYEIQIKLRAQDQPPPNVSVGVTSGVDNADTLTTWGVSPPVNPNYIHWGIDSTTIRSFPDGAKIRCNIFVAAQFQIWGYDTTIRRLY